VICITRIKQNKNLEEALQQLLHKKNLVNPKKLFSASDICIL